jgi:7,8-dihydro-6-hydroxymethylpterin-pyrophosphokinase
MTKLSQKLSKIDEDITVTFADNGFIITAQGRDSEDDWANIKIICHTMAELVELFEEAAKMERS